MKNHFTILAIWRTYLALWRCHVTTAHLTGLPADTGARYILLLDTTRAGNGAAKRKHLFGHRQLRQRALKLVCQYNLLFEGKRRMRLIDRALVLCKHIHPFYRVLKALGLYSCLFAEGQPPWRDAGQCSHSRNILVFFSRILIHA
jgi:hypothetical protein